MTERGRGYFEVTVQKGLFKTFFITNAKIIMETLRALLNWQCR